MWNRLGQRCLTFDSERPLIQTAPLRWLLCLDESKTITWDEFQWFLYYGRFSLALCAGATASFVIPIDLISFMLFHLFMCFTLGCSMYAAIMCIRSYLHIHLHVYTDSSLLSLVSDDLTMWYHSWARVIDSLDVRKECSHQEVLDSFALCSPWSLFEAG